MAEFSAKEFERLDPEAVAGFDPGQFQELDPKCNEGAFNAERLGALGPDVIKKMDLKQFENLPVDSFAGLNGEQIEVLPRNFMAEFSAKEFERLDPGAIKGIDLSNSELCIRSVMKVRLILND